MTKIYSNHLNSNSIIHIGDERNTYNIFTLLNYNNFVIYCIIY